MASLGTLRMVYRRRFCSGDVSQLPPTCPQPGPLPLAASYTASLAPRAVTSNDPIYQSRCATAATRQQGIWQGCLPACMWRRLCGQGPLCMCVRLAFHGTAPLHHPRYAHSTSDDVPAISTGLNDVIAYVSVSSANLMISQATGNAVLLLSLHNLLATGCFLCTTTTTATGNLLERKRSQGIALTSVDICRLCGWSAGRAACDSLGADTG